MDPIRRDDVDQIRDTPPAVKARQALDLFQTGLRLKRTNLRLRHPGATDAEIDEMVRAWLAADD